MKRELVKFSFKVPGSKKDYRVDYDLVQNNGRKEWTVHVDDEKEDNVSYKRGYNIYKSAKTGKRLYFEERI